MIMMCMPHLMFDCYLHVVQITKTRHM